MPKNQLPTKDYYKKKDYTLENSLKNLNYHGIFDTASSDIKNSYTIPYALFLGATNAEIGLLNAMKNLATTFAQIPGSWLARRFSRKFIWIFSMISSNILWLPIILAPFLQLNISSFIILIAIATFLLSLTSAAWTSLAGDLVPKERRGHFFGFRYFLIGLSGLIATMISGILIYYSFPLIFSISIILGFIAILFFIRIYEPETKRSFQYKYSLSFDLKSIKSSILMNEDLVIFTVFLTFMNFAVNMASPFIAVYQLRELNIGYLWFAAILSISALATIICHPYWGQLSDRFGERRIIAANGILVCFVPFFYLFSSSPLHILLVEIFSSFAWSGFNLATFSLLLSLTPQDKRTKYVANHKFFIGIGAMLGALLGGIMAETFKHSVFLLFSGLQIIFLVSFVLRLSSLLFMVKIRGMERKPAEYFLYRSIAVEPVRSVSQAMYYFRFNRIEKKLANPFRRIYYKIKMYMN